MHASGGTAGRASRAAAVDCEVPSAERLGEGLGSAGEGSGAATPDEEVRGPSVGREVMQACGGSELGSAEMEGVQRERRSASETSICQSLGGTEMSSAR